MKYWFLILLLISAFQLAASDENTTNESAIQPKKNAGVWVYSTDSAFDEVKENLLLAIQATGAVVSYTAHASDMLNRTAKDLSIKKKVYDKAETLLFCKAELSHKMVQADPHSLVLCPYSIAVYSLNGTPETTYLSIRRPPRDTPSYQAVQTMLQEIIAETLEF